MEFFLILNTLCKFGGKSVFKRCTGENKAGKYERIMPNMMICIMLLIEFTTCYLVNGYECTTVLFVYVFYFLCFTGCAVYLDKNGMPLEVRKDRAKGYKILGDVDKK